MRISVCGAAPVPHAGFPTLQQHAFFNITEDLTLLRFFGRADLSIKQLLIWFVAAKAAPTG